jgi:4,5-DOPA dioxygenase extradiol
MVSNMSMRSERRRFVRAALAGLAAATTPGWLACATEGPSGPGAPAAPRVDDGRTPPRRPASRWPTAFVGHGAPLLAIDPARGAPLRAWGTALGAPRAVLVLSAHWERAPLTVGTTQTRPLVYDFGGFSERLYQVRYAAPGAPWLAERVEALARAAGLPTAREPARGLDHGVWTPLVHLYPDANVPVLQVSLPTAPRGATRDAGDARRLFALGRALAPLREEGVLLLGSGNVTHNLRRVVWAEDATPETWASEMDAWTREVLRSRDFDALLDYRARAPAFALAHPTEEHWLPLIVVAGAASTTWGEVRFPVEGWEFGNLSRRAVEFA